MSHTIKHIVISGGSIWGFYAFGVIHECIQMQVIDIANIQSIYATSVGSILGVLLSLKIDIQVIEDYLIKRPWHQLLTKDNISYSYLQAIDERGIYHKGIFNECFKPLFKSVDLSLDITMAEFYEYSGIDLHIFVTELNNYKSMDVSHTTHPDWKLIDAVYASSALPILFAPIITENDCYIDGGFTMNYPLELCLASPNVDKNEVLSLLLGNNDPFEKTRVNNTMNIIDYITTLFVKLLQQLIFKSGKDISAKCNIPHEIKTQNGHNISLYDFYKLMHFQEERIKYVEHGKRECREKFGVPL